jgi:hypothetical protein
MTATREALRVDDDVPAIHRACDGVVAGGIEMQRTNHCHIQRTLVIACMLVPACKDEGGRGPAAGPGVGSDECVTPTGEPCQLPECDDPCAHNEARFDEECVLPEPGVCADERGVEITFQQAGATVPAPGGFFKPSDAALQKWITARWQEQADFVIPANVLAQLTAGGTKVWNYPDGWGWTRTDFHAGIMALPAGKTPQQLLRALVDDPEAATGRDELSGWVGWPAVGSGQRKVGDRIDLDLWGGDDGPIGYWKIDADRFCVITLENATAGTHPVNGIRCWGFVPMALNPNWLALPENQKKWGCAGQTYMFYTIGIDSPSTAGSGGIGSDLQAGTWNALIRDLLRENDKAGGVSGRWFYQKTVAQPNDLAPKSGVAVTPVGELTSYYVSLPSDDKREGEVCETPMTPAGECGEGQFTCSDGQCIESTKRCDGTADCTDRDDEDSCDGDDEGACPGQYACNDGQCIPSDWRCDGEYEDCSAGEDEQSCDGEPGTDDASGCPGDQFACTDGTCIDASWKCDVIVDCSDGVDEEGCSTDDPGTDPQTCDGFACDDGTCISAAWECDGIVDCSGEEDETGCPSEDPDPTGDDPDSCDGFTCDDGTCIAASWECDGYVDCADAEDEWCG